MKLSNLDILFIIFIILFFLFVGYSIYWMTTEGSKCVSNPLNYTQNQLTGGICGCFKVNP